MNTANKEKPTYMPLFGVRDHKGSGEKSQYFLARLGYMNFRLEHKIIILGDTNKDHLFNLIIILGKKVIYQTRGNRNQFSMRHLERILEIERESEEQFALNNDILEMYERKWERYLMA